MDRLDTVFELKNLSDTGEFTGYASTFGNIDNVMDRVKPGAFAKSLGNTGAKGVAMLWMHDRSQPIGVWTSLKEDERGLWAEGKLTLGVNQAREAHALMKDGALQSMSIGYFADKATVAADGIRDLEEISLKEVSLVSIPANDQARIVSVKSIDELETKRDFERFMRDVCGLSNQQSKAATARLARILHLKEQGQSESDMSDMDDIKSMIIEIENTLKTRS